MAQRDRRVGDRRIPTTPRNALQVNLHDDEDMRYWCKKMHCTEHQLREAVSQVGPVPSNVEAYVQQRATSLHNVQLPPGQRPS